MIEQSGIWTYCYTGKTRSHGTHVVQTFVALEEVDEGLAEQVEIIEFKAEYKREAESGRQSVWNIGATPISTYSASFFGRLCL